jgi:hypothetical protein
MKLYPRANERRTRTWREYWWLRAPGVLLWVSVP